MSRMAYRLGYAGTIESQKRSPFFSTRNGTVRMLNSRISKPGCNSSQSNGVLTVAPGFGTYTVDAGQGLPVAIL
jgi:hypothetical protein